jgi:phage FluMu protein Com
MINSINIAGIEIKHNCNVPDYYIILEPADHINNDELKQSVYCIGCGKKIAKAELPALVEIACPKCKTLNDLSRVTPTDDKTKPFAERLRLEKKEE